jgi:hypothetical protein
MTRRVVAVAALVTVGAALAVTAALTLGEDEHRAVIPEVTRDGPPDGSVTAPAPSSPTADTPGALAFSHRVIDPQPPTGSGCCLDVLALGDIDGDGLADVMVGAEHAAGIYWYRAPDWARYEAGDGDFTTDGEVVDFDGDGDGDIVISSISRNQVEWWENLGDPTRREGWALHDIGGDFVHDLAVADVNGDGRLDVAVFQKDGYVAWFEAPAGEGEWEFHGVAELAGEGLSLADVDGDGDTDVVASRFWFENEDGGGLDWEQHEVTGSFGDSTRAVTGDMNGDGALDIVLSHSEGTGRVSWFQAPEWEKRVIRAGELEGAHSLEVADFDGDGDLDVVTGEMHTSPEGRVLVFENLGGGLEWHTVELSGNGTHNARVADITGDGLPDIVGKNWDGPKVVEAWISGAPVD